VLAGLTVMQVLLARHVPAHMASACDSDDTSCIHTHETAQGVYITGAIALAVAIPIVLKYAKSAPRGFARATWIVAIAGSIALAAYTLLVFSTTDMGCG
jgi:hypothetical protein